MLGSGLRLSGQLSFLRYPVRTTSMNFIKRAMGLAPIPSEKKEDPAAETGTPACYPGDVPFEDGACSSCSHPCTEHKQAGPLRLYECLLHSQTENLLNIDPSLCLALRYCHIHFRPDTRLPQDRRGVPASRIHEAIQASCPFPNPWEILEYLVSEDRGAGRELGIAGDYCLLP